MEVNGNIRISVLRYATTVTYIQTEVRKQEPWNIYLSASRDFLFDPCPGVVSGHCHTALVIWNGRIRGKEHVMAETTAELSVRVMATVRRFLTQAEIASILSMNAGHGGLPAKN